jgi:hypothetical protein
MNVDPTPYIDLVKAGGPVLIAVVVVLALLYCGYRFVFAPAQRQSLAISEANREAATENAKAATAHQEASKANAATSEANTRTAGHLERITEMLLDAALQKK